MIEIYAQRKERIMEREMNWAMPYVHSMPFLGMSSDCCRRISGGLIRIARKMVLSKKKKTSSEQEKTRPKFYVKKSTSQSLL
jgi:hypothetical protein